VARTRRERGWPPPPDPLPAPVVDNHTHLETVLEVVADPPRTLAEHLALAAEVGVPQAVQIGCDLESARWTDIVVAERPELLGGVGIHPNEAVLHAGIHEVAPDGLDPNPLERHAVALDDAVAEIAALARANPRIRVVGETGLDYFRAGERGRQVQREAFRAHVAVAKELDLVLQIHDRDAHEDVLEVLERDGAPPRTVFHCFSGDAEMARRCAAHGWYLSFAGPVSYPANGGLREALRSTPPELLLVETDAPYLGAQPVRGRPNAPYLLPHTVRAVAAVLERPLAEVCEALGGVARELYGF
jgi:TatD DNase family protein